MGGTPDRGMTGAAGTMMAAARVRGTVTTTGATALVAEMMIAPARVME